MCESPCWRALFKCFVQFDIHSAGGASNFLRFFPAIYRIRISVPISGNVTYHLRSANEGNTHLIMYILINIYACLVPNCILIVEETQNKHVYYSIYTLIQLIKKPREHHKIHYLTHMEVKEAYNKCVHRTVGLHFLSALFSLTFIWQGHH